MRKIPADFRNPGSTGVRLTLVVHAGFVLHALGGKLDERDESTVPIRLMRNVC
jgi:hypothetical protein